MNERSPRYSAHGGPEIGCHDMALLRSGAR